MSIFLDEYQKAFPSARLSIFQTEMIETNVTDFDAWQEAITFWAGNDYRAQSVFKIIEYYKGIKNGTNQKLSERDKSAARAVNAERLANAIANGDENTVRDILGGNGQDRSTVHLIG